MIFKHFDPVPELQPYVDCFWIIEASSSPDNPQQAQLPADSRPTLLLNFTSESRLVGADGSSFTLGAGATLLGVRRQSFTIEHAGATYLLAAQFRPGGFAPFVPYSLGELAERTHPLDVLWGKAGDHLPEQVGDASTLVEKLAVYQANLLAHFVEVPHQARIQYALAQIDRSPGVLPVEDLAEQVNLSQKQFERQFERVVGMMPKAYIRLARFQKLVRWLTHPTGPANWTTLAAQFGYYDHSHMVKDFKAYVGTTPGEFLAATAGIVEVAYGRQGEKKTSNFYKTGAPLVSTIVLKSDQTGG